MCEHDGKVIGALTTGEVFTMVYDSFTTTQKNADKNGEETETQVVSSSFVFNNLLKVGAVKLVSKFVASTTEDKGEDAVAAANGGKGAHTAVQVEDEEEEVQVNKGGKSSIYIFLLKTTTHTHTPLQFPRLCH